MMKALEITGEVAAQVVVFILAFSLSTGLACSKKAVSCDDSRDEAAEVRTP